ncbi:MAG: hypothetical protein KDI59_11355 [Xanthomonadales bacterium]|nr:hypothetical protein [Xanthomonadales bacterium]MCB1605238.1 hypothetical protein [Xanthomonadales bacterium]
MKKIINVRLIVNTFALIVLMVLGADKTLGNYFYPLSSAYFTLIALSVLSVLALLVNLVISIVRYTKKLESATPLIINIIMIALVPIMLTFLP